MPLDAGFKSSAHLDKLHLQRYLGACLIVYFYMRWARSSGVEHRLHTAGVAGSKPAAPTISLFANTFF
jgi:hypothetical protein